MEMLNVKDQNIIGQFHAMDYVNSMQNGGLPQYHAQIRPNVSNLYRCVEVFQSVKSKKFLIFLSALLD